MPIEIATFLGLQTDPPPDRLGDAKKGFSAFIVRNMVPVSATAIRARNGVTKIHNYKPGALGRNVIVDALPEDNGNGILIAVVNTRVTGSGANTLNHAVEGLFEFRPPRVAAAYASVTGLDLTASLDGVII